MYSLELHFLQKLRQLLFGSDVVKADGVDVFLYEFLFQIELLDVTNAFLIFGDDIDIASGPGLGLGFGL